MFGDLRHLSLTERDRVIRDGVANLPGPAARQLLDAIMLPSGARAELIGRLHRHPDGRQLAELLIDFEEDRQLALDFAHALKDHRGGGGFVYGQ